MGNEHKWLLKEGGRRIFENCDISLKNTPTSHAVSLALVMFACMSLLPWICVCNNSKWCLPSFVCPSSCTVLLIQKRGWAYFWGWAYFRYIMIYHTAGINCVDLNDPMNGEVTFNTTLNSQAHYSCSDGYCLNGNQYRTCQCGGNWTGTEPTCGPGKQC